ncbi:hypothetical protein BCIN_09g04270 [Botrytis cinerea B05.10]|uniref:Uncharacterized protein n=1 Tax=Botryotinia fuckeliana (strain B05.10) TaxID=332648 RepID=A0A384JSQ1_BOTFB|nr:hypothetical protein BCIN_09g04270 [Botrytis cinerea B05.10]ATZ53618.1 hypothetical protein BCIN_09g04270 [Botrytis cinerea B05.10]
MTSIPKIAVDNILPPQPLKRTRLKADLESIFSGFNVIEKPNQDNRFNFGTGHHYIHFMDGAELYVDSDGSGIYVDIAGFRSLFVRPKKQQEALRREIVKELMNASDLELLRFGVRRFFAKRAVRELGILKLRRYGYNDKVDAVISGRKWIVEKIEGDDLRPSHGELLIELIF